MSKASWSTLSPSLSPASLSPSESSTPSIGRTAGSDPTDDETDSARGCPASCCEDGCEDGCEAVSCDKRRACPNTWLHTLSPDAAMPASTTAEAWLVMDAALNSKPAKESVGVLHERTRVRVVCYEGHPSLERTEAAVVAAHAAASSVAGPQRLPRHLQKLVLMQGGSHARHGPWGVDLQQHGLNQPGRRRRSFVGMGS